LSTKLDNHFLKALDACWHVMSTGYWQNMPVFLNWFCFVAFSEVQSRSVIFTKSTFAPTISALDDIQV
jgi:hypothetical protein